MEQSAVTQSFGRCSVNPKFLDRFYEIFLASSPAIAPLFRNTDFAKQKVALRSGLTLMMMYNEGNKLGQQGLDRIGQSHSRQKLKIDPSLYPYWIDSLIKTVKECDPKCDATLEAEWRTALKKGAKHIADQF